eukprot:8912958-Lingulodinium_polyedra.AAC.1
MLRVARGAARLARARLLPSLVCRSCAVAEAGRTQQPRECLPAPIGARARAVPSCSAYPRR